MGLFDTFWKLAQQNEIDTANRVNSDLQNQNLDQEITLKNNQDLMHTMQMRIIELEAKLNQAKGTTFRVADLERKIKELEEDAREDYSEKTKLQQTAKKHTPFSESKKIATLANFMIWEKAYKEQALTYAMQLGKTVEEVLEENLKFQEIVKNQQSEFGNNIPENILLDSNEYNVAQQSRWNMFKRQHKILSDMQSNNNRPIKEDDTETRYPWEHIDESLAGYELQSEKDRKERILQKERERREHEADCRRLDAIMKK